MSKDKISDAEFKEHVIQQLDAIVEMLEKLVAGQFEHCYCKFIDGVRVPDPTCPFHHVHEEPVVAGV